MSASAEDANAAFEKVAGLLLALAKEPSAKRLMDIAKQNETLKKENKSLDDAILGTNITITRLRNQLKSAEDRSNKTDSERQAAIKASEGLSKQLKAVQNRLETSQQRARDLEASFKTQLETEVKKWEETNEELERLTEYVVPLSPVTVQDSMKPLNDIYTVARKLVQDHFCTDLPSDLLAESLWDEVRHHNPNTTQIPLLMSNTPAAKQMRVAAVLAALASELCQHIFQPTYLLKDPTGLNKLLDNLVTDDRDHESYLRAALLCASECTRHDGAAAAIKAVVDGVCALVEKLLPEARRDTFRRELENLCTDACTTWQAVQRLEDRVAPQLGTSRPAKLKYQWKPLFDLPLPPAPAAAPTKQHAAVNATASAAAAAAAAAQGTSSRNQQAAAAASPKLPVAAADNHNTPPPDHLADGIAVWPAFYNKSAEDDETLAEGFILPGALIRVADEEQRMAMTSPPTPVSSRSSQAHRARDAREQGRNARRYSVANKNGRADVEGSRNGSASFLSAGSGGGGKGA